MVKKAGITAAALFLLTSVGMAQDNRFDVSLNVVGVLSKHSEGSGIVLAPTQAGGFLGTIRLRFTPKASVEMNYGRTKNAQIYSAPPFDFRIQSTVSEFTGAFLFSPFQTAKLEPFLVAGTGVLVFNPDATFINSNPGSLGAVRQNEIAWLYGVGADYRFFSRFSLRLQYRGLFYSAPDFRVTRLFTGSKGHMAEPSAGIVFRF
jgi:opacity protein-like surface antigen